MSRIDDERSALIARWFELTRSVMPAMAVAERWPIALDHCFMRVCLDAACGAPWSARIRAPAIRNLPLDRFAAAVEAAEAIVRVPSLLHDLNERSLEGRRHHRRAHGRDAVLGAHSPAAED